MSFDVANFCTLLIVGMIIFWLFVEKSIIKNLNNFRKLVGVQRVFLVLR